MQAIHHHHTVLIFYIVLCWIYFASKSLLCCTVVSVLVLGIGIARGQYYWILDIGCLVWYRSNPTQQSLLSVAGLSLVMVSGHAISYTTDEEFKPVELQAAEVVWSADCSHWEFMIWLHCLRLNADTRNSFWIKTNKITMEFSILDEKRNSTVLDEFWTKNSQLIIDIQQWRRLSNQTAAVIEVHRKARHVPNIGGIFWWGVILAHHVD